MTPDAYRQRIAELGYTQERAGEVLGVTGRTGQTWATKGPPIVVAMLLALIKDMRHLERLRRKVDPSYP